jgi:hypothetical protein
MQSEIRWSQIVTTSGERHRMDGHTSLVPVERIERAILSIRGEKVMLDSDLAELYGVETKVLNQAVKRNIERFPADFMFQLTQEEYDDLVRLRSQFVTLKRGEHRKYLPYAFTEHGALMLANVLNSERAAQTSVQVVRVPPGRDATAADAGLQCRTGTQARGAGK